MLPSNCWGWGRAKSLGLALVVIKFPTGFAAAAFHEIHLFLDDFVHVVISGAFHAGFGLLEHNPTVGLDVQGIRHAGDIVIGPVVIKGPAFSDQTANEGPNLAGPVFLAGILLPVGYDKDLDLVLLLLQVQDP
ncbi:MAG: hypothetical protein EBX50_20125 [Chitinophagia bacterium]|nr:hypothetical protein [Chitinophagia bacterium]